ncbi:fibronectin type III domain-containing protein, partial [Runella zeae]|uniref:fibronectin type III domain-containing protein n=1 Tax=Runella zeae TaxID=94255 RepID=UPI000568E8B7
MKTLFKLFVGLLWLALMLSYSLQAAVPGVPQSFSATAASASQINLSWKAPTATPALTGYELHRSEDNKSFAKIADIATGTATYQDKNLKGNTTYYYRLYALNKDGKSTAAEDNAKTQVTQTFTLSPPSNLAAASSSPTNIQVNWTNNHSYSKIELRYTTNPNNTGGELLTLNGNTTQYNLTGLEPNTKYYIVLQAFLVIEGGVEYSSIKVGTNATTQNPTPSTPSGLNITGKSDNTIGVSWNAVSGAEGYQLRISDISDFSKGVNTFDINSTTSSYKFTNLLSGNTYWIQIRAKNNFNKVDYWSNWSGSVSTSTDNPPPAAPTGVNATALSSTQIEVKWTDASNNESKFIINRSDQSSSGPWVQVGEVGANSQSFMNNGTQSSKTYYYQVCAVNSGGQNCALSNKVTTPSNPPLPPGKLVVSINGTSASLSWEDAAANETGYEIERKEGNGSFTRIYTSGSFSGTGTFNDTKLNNGTTYCYRVRAVNSDGVSTYSNEACGTTPEATPNAPSNLVASTPNARQVNLSWNNNSANQTKIEIHRSENNDSFVEVGSIDGSSTTYTDQNLTPNKKYYYKVRALNNGGSSAFSNVAEVTTLPEIPKAATGLTATAVSSSQIDLKWTDNSDNETGFDLERSSDGSNFSGLTSLGAGVVTFQNTGLSASTKYYYRVRAKNSAGVSDWSNIADATTQSPPVTVPKAATSLTATAVSSSQIDLKWTDNSDNETGFDLERSSDGSNFSGLTSLGAGVVTFQNTGLSASTKYYYRVRAKNSAGVSDWSNIADATTQSPP